MSILSGIPLLGSLGSATAVKVESPEDERWMITEMAPQAAAEVAPYGSRFVAVGVKIPEATLSSKDLMESAVHHPRIDLERLTGIRSRHVAGEGEDSFTLAVGAAEEAIRRAGIKPSEIEMLINCSITRYQGGLSQRMEPPLSLAIKQAIGAPGAISFDISNACAGMLTGTFILNDFIRRGVIRRGMVVSGEYITNLAGHAVEEVHSILSNQLASLTLGDAGAAAILERAPRGASGIDIVSFTTLAEHSRLCLAYPAKHGPGAVMHTKAQTMQKLAIQDIPVLLAEALELSGIKLEEVDYVIPHQTSARAIKKGLKALGTELGAVPRHMVINIEENGNTASTTHFLALHRYLTEGRFKKGDRVVLLALASGIEVGVVSFTVDDMVDRYGHDD